MASSQAGTADYRVGRWRYVLDLLHELDMCRLQIHQGTTAMSYGQYVGAIRCLLSQQYFLTADAMEWLPSQEALLRPVEGLPPPPKRPRCDGGATAGAIQPTRERSQGAVAEQPAAPEPAVPEPQAGHGASANAGQGWGWPGNLASDPNQNVRDWIYDCTGSYEQMV